MTVGSEPNSRTAANVEVDRIAALTAALGYLDVEKVRSWGRVLADRFQQGGRILVVGIGVSAAQAQHLVAELVGRFESERAPLAAMALTTDSAVVTARGMPETISGKPWATRAPTTGSPDSSTMLCRSRSRVPDRSPHVRGSRAAS
ncbi:SIS domain-containing protein [Nocardia gipuzkoensis]|uniref:SIS domain-containing protein n=1 Tax=Nocardia gipuzkoensis TaxID=2749991 RepID=UPI0038CD6C92